MNYNSSIKYSCFTIFFLAASIVFGQTTIKQKKMELLSFMVGDWIGTSKAYEDGSLTHEVPAFQKISYDLDKNILVIELNSETLLLHTVIYYDEKDETYYYYPFSKRGVSRYPATFENGQLIVQPSESRRFIFSRLTGGGFREYGEKLVDGKWTKYFEDTFTDSK